MNGRNQGKMSCDEKRNDSSSYSSSSDESSSTAESSSSDKPFSIGRFFSTKSSSPSFLVATHKGMVDGYYLVKELRDCVKMEMKDMDFHGKEKCDCFLSSSAIDAMIIERWAKTRLEATIIGRELVNLGIIENVDHEKDFIDDHSYFCYVNDGNHEMNKTKAMIKAEKEKIKAEKMKIKAGKKKNKAKRKNKATLSTITEQSKQRKKDLKARRINMAKPKRRASTMRRASIPNAAIMSSFAASSLHEALEHSVETPDNVSTRCSSRTKNNINTEPDCAAGIDPNRSKQKSSKTPLNSKKSDFKDALKEARKKHNLGVVYMASNLEKAEENFRQALTLYRQNRLIFTPGHSDITKTHEKLAEIAKRQKKPTIAHKHFEAALKNAIRANGSESVEARRLKYAVETALETSKSEIVEMTQVGLSKETNEKLGNFDERSDIIVGRIRNLVIDNEHSEKKDSDDGFVETTSNISKVRRGNLLGSSMEDPKATEEGTSNDKLHHTNVNKANDSHTSKVTEEHHPSFLTPLKDESILTTKSKSKPPHRTLISFHGSVNNSDNSFEKDHFLEGEAAFQAKEFSIARKHFLASLEVRMQRYGEDSVQVAFCEERLGDVSMAMLAIVEARERYLNAYTSMTRTGYTLRDENAKATSSELSGIDGNVLLHLVAKLGNVYCHLREWKKALNVLEEANSEMNRCTQGKSAESQNQRQLTRNIVKCYIGLAEDVLMVGDFDDLEEACSYYEKSLQAMKIYDAGVVPENGYYWEETTKVVTALAFAHFEMGSFVDAKKFYSEALARNGGSEKELDDVVSLLQSLGKTHEKLDRFNEAIENYTKAFDIKQKMVSNDSQTGVFGTLQCCIASCYLELGFDDSALRHFNDALASFKSNDGNESGYDEYADATNRLVLIYIKRGELDTVIEYYDDLSNFLSNHDTSSHKALVSTLEKKACVQIKLLRYKQACNTFERVLSIMQNLPRDKMDDELMSAMSNNLRCIGATAFCAGDNAKALERFKECMNMMGDFDKVGLYNSMAIIYCQELDYKSAMSMYSKALRLIRIKFKGNHPELVSLLINQGNIFYNQDNMDKCLECYEKAERLISNIGTVFHKHSAGLNYNMGLGHLQEENYEKAEICLREALEVTMALENDDDISVAAILNSLGNVSSGKLDHSSAKDFYNRSIEERRAQLGLSPEQRCESVVQTYSNIAIACGKQKQYRKAEAYIEMGLKAIKEVADLSDEEKFSILTSKLYIQLGNVFIHVGDLDLSMQNFGKSLRILSKLIKMKDLDFQGKQIGVNFHEVEQEMHRARHGIGLVLSMKGKFDEAIEIFKDILEQKKQHSYDQGNDMLNDPDAGKLLCDMARIKSLNGNFEEAIMLIDESITILVTWSWLPEEHHYVEEARELKFKLTMM